MTVVDENYPMISYDSFIGMFILDCPNGERKYFRDYEGAEDFFRLNFEGSDAVL